MQSYTLNDALTKYSELLAQADDEPVILKQESQPTHIILSVENFEKLLQRLEELEDLVIEQSENDINNYRDENKLVLSERDSKLFISVMQNPPEPSEGLRSLFNET
ncbi:hypothetical protein DSM106972_006750 [Dulcicalothrix desertica PCC 7102]|uniref:Uncharacterized protein n=1 Tax=Dulcicalothrix desertica PCC 7102 TaxID=232991 RepID=A0A433VVS3_9CYAN|nr:type II toxin-antitoxin system Phd/YefM family antitoxin [Dulcicalothrix desertica]RUT10180.1 hypothetical protein DSM106972_006750 [Dulcicalothrix desertica PCC 7102]TWH40838.1 antitoxin Phd_YefM of type II toxin-antitoxin system [Dulcicalothrix desertica PCC 7102]